MTELPIQHARASRYDSVVAFLRDRSFSEWILLIYPILIFSVHRHRSPEDFAVVDRSAVFQIVITGICGLYAVHRWFKSEPILKRLLTQTSIVWMLLYGVLALFSLLWSGIPELTAFRAVQFLVFLFLLADVLTNIGEVENLIRLQLCYSAVVAFFWQFSFLLTSFSLTAIHSSQVPGVVVGSVFTGCLLRSMQWRALHLFVISAVLLGTSTATYLSVAVGLTAILLTLSHRRIEGLLLLGMIALGVLAFPNTVMRSVFYGKSSANIASASGRLPTWEWTIQQQVQNEKIFLGYGYSYGEVQARLYNIRGLRMQHMHSAPISAFVNPGVIGFILLCCFWIGLWRNAYSMQPGLLRSMTIGAFAAVCLNSLAIASVSSQFGFEWIGHMLVFGMAVPASIVAGHVIAPEINMTRAPGMTISTQHVSHGRRLDANR